LILLIFSLDLRLQELIKRNQKKLAENITCEQGKTLADAEGDVFRGLQVLFKLKYNEFKN